MYFTLFCLIVLSFSLCCGETIIDNVVALNEAISNGVHDGRVGFLSRGNYEAVQSILPLEAPAGPLTVVVYDNCTTIGCHVADIERDVFDGKLLAGLTSTRPPNSERKLIEFGASLVSLRGALFKKDAASADLVRAIDASLIRMIAGGEFRDLNQKYFDQFSFEATAAFSCSPAVANFPFPNASTATGQLKEVLENKTLYIGSLGPYNWGYQGNYQEDPATGFWPEYTSKVLAHFQQAYPGVSVEPKWFTGSVGVMESVEMGESHMTEFYWTLPAFYKGATRSESFEQGCTAGGFESVFFTADPNYSSGDNSGNNSDDDDSAAVAITISVVLAVLVCVLLAGCAYLTYNERKGSPVFSQMKDYSFNEN